MSFMTSAKLWLVDLGGQSPDPIFIQPTAFHPFCYSLIFTQYILLNFMMQFNTDFFIKSSTRQARNTTKCLDQLLRIGTSFF